MAATTEDVINAVVEPAWIGIAAELFAALPEDLDPRERMSLLFAALHVHLDATDWIASAAVYSRIAALGRMDQNMQISDLSPAGNNPDNGALRHAVATAPLHTRGEHFVFDPATFRSCFAAARQRGPGPTEMEPEREGQKAPEMTAAEKTRVARKLDERVQTLTSAGLDDVTLFAVMSEHMTEFKRLLDAAEPGELDRLGQHFPAFGHYVAVLSSIAVALRDGAIEIPR